MGEVNGVRYISKRVADERAVQSRERYLANTEEKLRAILAASGGQNNRRAPATERGEVHTDRTQTPSMSSRESQSSGAESSGAESNYDSMEDMVSVQSDHWPETERERLREATALRGMTTSRFILCVLLGVVARLLLEASVMHNIMSIWIVSYTALAAINTKLLFDSHQNYYDRRETIGGARWLMMRAMGMDLEDDYNPTAIIAYVVAFMWNQTRDTMMIVLTFMITTYVVNEAAPWLLSLAFGLKFE